MTLTEETPQERMLATVRTIDSIEPIEGADKIELCSVGGWKVVAQKGLYEVGGLALYFEIDSWIPHTLAPFLTKEGKQPQVFNQVEGQRLKTIRLRGQVSQGLLMPIAEIDAVLGLVHLGDLYDGDDMTAVLGVQKWEKPLAANLAGKAKGNFPSFIPKTDQPRIQNMKKVVEQLKEDLHCFEVTEKLDGSSMTAYINNSLFGVCSRNLDLIETEGNSFWLAARKYDLEGKLISLGRNLAIQGELVGQGIQGNSYNISADEVSRFYVYDIFCIDTGKYLLPAEVQGICEKLGLHMVPVYSDLQFDSDTSIEKLLELAEGLSTLNLKAQREGLVLKSLSDPTVSFKVISNKWLLKNDG